MAIEQLERMLTTGRRFEGAPKAIRQPSMNSRNGSERRRTGQRQSKSSSHLPIRPEAAAGDLRDKKQPQTIDKTANSQTVATARNRCKRSTEQETHLNRPTGSTNSRNSTGGKPAGERKSSSRQRMKTGYPGPSCNPTSRRGYARDAIERAANRHDNGIPR